MAPPQGIGRTTSSGSAPGLNSLAGQGVSAALALPVRNAVSSTAAASSCFTEALRGFDGEDARAADQRAETAGQNGDGEEQCELTGCQTADRPVDDLDRGDQSVGQRRENEE